MKLISALTLLLAANRVAADCGPDGAFTAAGSTTVFPLAVVWEKEFEAICPNVDITVEGGGSSTGAKRVCGVTGVAPAAIGMMSRGWKSTEATVAADGFTYKCLIGDKSLSIAQIVVANDGITVVAYDSLTEAGICLKKMNKDGGLTKDQLRWMFSSWSEEQLKADGWNPASIPFPDGNPSTRLWSELNPKCVSHPIGVAVPNKTSGTYEFFTEAILTGLSKGETLRYDFMAAGGDGEVVDYLLTHEDAVGFAGYPIYADRADVLRVSFVNGVEPTVDNISGGLYTLLGRQIYMNLRTSEAELTEHYVEYGLSLPTVEGYVPLSAAQLAKMLARLESLHTVPSDDDKK